MEWITVFGYLWPSGSVFSHEAARMPKRKTKAEKELLGLAIVVGLIVWCAKTVIDSSALPLILIFGFVLIGAIIWYRRSQYKARLALLRSKYANEEVVQRILQHTFWEGQSQEQLIDSLGSPLGIDRKLLITKRREVWKYNRRGANRYGLRITLDNGFVTGWDHKQ